jgi:hypothetical protein
MWEAALLKLYSVHVCRNRAQHAIMHELIEQLLQSQVEGPHHQVRSVMRLEATRAALHAPPSRFPQVPSVQACQFSLYFWPSVTGRETDITTCSRAKLGMAESQMTSGLAIQKGAVMNARPCQTVIVLTWGWP